MSAALRAATPADLDAIMDLERAVFPTDAWARDVMAAELAGPHGYYLVAVDAERVVGYAGLLAPRGSGQADIQTVAVALDARGQGLGRALVTELLAEAARRTAREVFLEVRADNPVARALYTALGFEEIAVRPRYYQPDGVDAVVMQRTESTGEAA